MDDSTKIWRYLDISKFIALLSRGIHFTRPNAFCDNWEGAWGVKNVIRFREEYFGRPEEGATEWNARVAEKRRRLNKVGLSCWHRSKCESAALWEFYMPKGQGVAVQSTVGRITTAIAAIDRTIEVIEVAYADFLSEELAPEPSILLSHKRPEFQHESEVRFLLRFTEDEEKAIDMLEQVYDETDTRWISLSPVNGGLVRSGPGIGVMDRTAVDRATPVGVHLRIPAASIIEKIYLAPKVGQPTRYAVLDVAEKYGLDRQSICVSSIDMIAPDRLKFFP